MRGLGLIVISVLLVSCGGNGGGDDDDGMDVEASPGCGEAGPTGLMNRTITVDGMQRSYLLSVPATYDPETAAALVFAWHERGVTPDASRALFGLEAPAPMPAIFVYPQGLPHPEDPNYTTWFLEADGVDVALYDAIVAELRASHCIGKVFSTGYELGGSFTNFLACHRVSDAPGSLGGVVSVAGGLPMGCNGAAIAAAVIHGTQDPVLPSTQSSIMYMDYTFRNGCSGDEEPTESFRCEAYTTCTRAPARYCLHGGAHVWPSWAASEIWSLFQAAP